MHGRGPQEARVLGVERGLEAIDRDLRFLRIQMSALSQGIWSAWSERSSGNSTCTATFTGTLLGCGGAGISGQTLTVQNPEGLALGSVVTGSGGAFSGSLSIASPFEQVTLSCSATSYVPFSTTATLKCGSNSLGNLTMTPIVTRAPTINTPGNVTVCGTSGTVSLSGITDGNSGTALPIHVTATSSNTAIIPNPSVIYTSPNTTGTLNYTVSSAGTATITLKVTNSGSTFCLGVPSATTTFTIAARIPTSPTVVNPGNFTDSTTFGLLTLTITGIGPGAGNSSGANLSVSVTSSNSTQFPVSGLSYTSPNTTATFKLTVPEINASTTITYTVTDNNPARCGPNTTTVSYQITTVVG